MANMFVWLLAAVWPLAKQVLVSLGVGWITYEAVTALVDVLKGYVAAQIGSFNGTLLQLVSLSGCVEAVGIILGALTARAALTSMARLGKVTT